MLRTTLIAALLTTLSSSAEAQKLPRFKELEELRIEMIRNEQVNTQYKETRADTLVVIMSPYLPPRLIPADSIFSIRALRHVSFGQRFGETTLLGAGIGAALGAVVGLVMGQEGGARDLSRVGPILIGVVGGAMAANALRSGDRWTEVYRRSP